MNFMEMLFDCEAVAYVDEDISAVRENWVRLDVSVQCFDRSWKLSAFLAIFTIVWYTFGFPTMLFLRMSYLRRHVKARLRLSELPLHVRSMMLLGHWTFVNLQDQVLFELSSHLMPRSKLRRRHGSDRSPRRPKSAAVEMTAAKMMAAAETTVAETAATGALPETRVAEAVAAETTAEAETAVGGGGRDGYGFGGDDGGETTETGTVTVKELKLAETTVVMTVTAGAGIKTTMAVAHTAVAETATDSSEMAGAETAALPAKASTRADDDDDDDGDDNEIGS
ncbi:hypothetical protein CYMTET_8681 [Cymbomonas tetramitiformis]|uniref:Uncharacterized protein n=1 Tax=Cymbomonas tetramitiformis TaxID=36881 RepID=A0AAE0GT21_9CHLO|nr:hypothetical protein CYMTET_8681 [Cymbomonas tetramitiformis]